MTNRPVFSGHFFKELEVIFSVRSRDNEFVFIKAIFSFLDIRARVDISIGARVSIIWRAVVFIRVWALVVIFLMINGVVRIGCVSFFLVDVVDESPFFEEVVYSDDGSNITRQRFSGLQGWEVLIFGEFDDMVSIFFVEFFVFFEFYVVLSREECLPSRRGFLFWFWTILGVLFSRFNVRSWGWTIVIWRVGAGTC